MRLCIVCQEYPPVTDYYGGIGAQYGQLAPELVRLGHEVHAVTLMPNRREPEPVCAGVHVHHLRRGRAWPWHPLEWSSRVEHALRELGPFDVVLSPEFRGEAFHYSREQHAGPLVTHLLTSSAQLLSIRPGLTWLERHGPLTRVALAIERRQAERSSALLAPGRAVLDWARALWSIEQIHARVVPLSINLAAVREAADRNELPDGFPRNGPTVTLASRLDGHKGAQQLLHAMKQVWRSHPAARLVYVGRDARWGRGWMSDYLRELAGPHVDRVHILGYQAPGPYFAAVAASDLIAIPSLWESFCLAAVEAMALGRPVIGTSGHGFSEFIRDGENGLLVERGDVPALAQAVQRLLNDSTMCKRLGAAAGRTAEALDVASVAPLYVDALGSIALDARGPEKA